MVAHGGDRRQPEVGCGGDRRRRRQGVLRVHHVGRPRRELGGEEPLEPPPEPEIALEAPHVRDVVQRVSEVGDRDPLELAAANAGEIRLRLDHPHRVAARGERAGEVKRAPAASPAARREGVGDDQHAHWFAAENAIPTRA